MKLFISGGHLIDPYEGQNSGKNLLIENGKVVAWLGHNEAAPEDAEVFDANGMIVAPGIYRLARASARAGTGTQGNDCVGLRGGGCGRLDERLSDAEYVAG
jgi:predicted amidohydrolase